MPRISRVPHARGTCYHATTTPALSACLKRLFPLAHSQPRGVSGGEPRTVAALIRHALANYLIENNLHCDFTFEDLTSLLHAGVQWDREISNRPEWGMTAHEITTLVADLGSERFPEHYEPLPEAARVAFLRARRRHLALFDYTAARDGTIVHDMQSLESSFMYATEAPLTDPALDGLF